jgi:hypothetical protein
MQDSFGFHSIRLLVHVPFVTGNGDLIQRGKKTPEIECIKVFQRLQVFNASQTILLQIPEHLLQMKRIATNSKLGTSSSISQVPHLDLLYQENGWGQSAFDMKPESRERIESLERVECEKGRLLGDDQESAKARKEGLTGN